MKKSLSIALLFAFLLPLTFVAGCKKTTKQQEVWPQNSALQGTYNFVDLEFEFLSENTSALVSDSIIPDNAQEILRSEFQDSFITLEENGEVKTNIFDLAINSEVIAKEYGAQDGETIATSLGIAVVNYSFTWLPSVDGKKVILYDSSIAFLDRDGNEIDIATVAGEYSKFLPMFLSALQYFEVQNQSFELEFDGLTDYPIRFYVMFKKA